MSPDPPAYNGLTFTDMYKILSEEEANISEFNIVDIEMFKKVARIFGDSKPGLIHLFWWVGNVFKDRTFFSVYQANPLFRTMPRLAEFGLTEGGTYDHHLTETGRQLLLRLKLERETKKAEELVKDHFPK